MPTFTPTIFIPGIQGTALADTNTFGFDLVWNAYDTVGSSVMTSIMGPYIDEGLSIDPRFDQRLTAVIERHHIARMPYQGAMSTYQRKFADKRSPLFLFGYDWRKSNLDSGRKLYEFLQYLTEKFNALGHSITGFHFIAHSMGSHVAGCCLGMMRHHNKLGLVRKVVLCAPPLKGSPYALEGMIVGKGGLGRFFRNLLGQDDEMRKAIRTFPAVFELLPWYDGALRYEDGGEVNLLEESHWQSNLIRDDTRQLFIERLRLLARYRSTDFPQLDSFDAETRRKIIVIYGADSDNDTLEKLLVKREFSGTRNYVRLGAKEVRAYDGMGHGDGTVPEKSATAYCDAVRTYKVMQDGILSEPKTHLDFHGMFLHDSRVKNIMFRFLEAESTEPQAIGGQDWFMSRSDDVELVGNYQQ